MDFSVVPVLNLLVILFAFLAAVFWFNSSVQKIPSEITVGWGGTGGSAQELGKALQKIGRLNGWAAFFAGLAAIVELITVGVTSCMEMSAI